MRKILLDECVDRRLADEITAHDVKTVHDVGWAGLKNGELLSRAQRTYDVFVTTDRNLMFQQDLTKFDVAVIVLAGTTNRLQDLLPMLSRLMEALPLAQPGDVLILNS